MIAEFRRISKNYDLYLARLLPGKTGGGGSLTRIPPGQGFRVVGSLDHWVVGSLGRWVVGSLGRWVVGSCVVWIV